MKESLSNNMVIVNQPFADSEQMFKDEILQFKLLDVDIRHKKEKKLRNYVNFRENICNLMSYSQKQLEMVQSESLKQKHHNVKQSIEKIKERRVEYD